MKNKGLLSKGSCILLVFLLIAFSYFCNKRVSSEVVDIPYGDTHEDELLDVKIGKVIEENYVYTISEMDEIKLPLYNVPIFDGNISVKLFTEDDKEVFNESYSYSQINQNQSYIVINTSNLELSKDQIFKVKVANNTTSTISFKSFKVEVKGSSDDEKKYDAVINATVSGVNYLYHYGVIEVLLLLILIVSTFLYVINTKCKYKKVVDKLLTILEKYRLLYIFEAILFFITILMLLACYVELYNYDNINMVFVFATMAMLTFSIVYVIELFRNASGNVSKYFLTLSIPLVVCYLLFIVPNAVPDEFVHFVKTYATSNFDFGTPASVDIPQNLIRSTNYSYSTFFEQLFSTTDYALVEPAQTAGYNFVLYFIPSLGLNIARLFHLSIMSAYLFARLFNAILFIFVGYQSIKRIPFGKWVLFVYLLSPMFLQQACSVSADNLVNVVAIFSISYLLFLYKSENPIEWRDVVLMSCMVIILTITKYIYLPVFGLVFLSFDKLKVMDMKKWIVLILIIPFGFLIYYYFSIYLPSLVENTYALDYVLSNNINQSEQIKLILSHPSHFLKVIHNTYESLGHFYMTSAFISPLSWLNIYIEEKFYYFYILVLMIAIGIEDSKVKLKKSQKIWILFLSTTMILAVLLSLYLTWTPVGGEIVLGIQGRYFLPIFMLLLLLFVGKKKIYLRHPNFVVIISLMIIHYVTLATVLDFFRFANM